MVFSASSDQTLLVSQRVALPEGNGLVLRPAGVLIEQGLIKEIWPLDKDLSPADILEAKPGVRLIDFGEYLMTPAFVNAHTHVTLTALRAVPLESATAGNMVEQFFFQVEALMQPADVRAFARLGALECLLHGVGLVWDHYYEAQAVAEALVDTGLCGVMAPTLQDESGPGCHAWEQGLSDTVTIAEGTRWAAQGIFAGVGPHATDTVSAQLWSKALEVAGKYRLPVHAHLAQSIEEVQRVYEREGCSPTEWLHRMGVLHEAPRGVWAHGLYISRKELEYLSSAQHALVYCPYSQLIFGFPARVGEWTKANVPWVVATDAAASNDSMNIQKELRYVDGQRTMGTAFSTTYEQFMDSGRKEDAENVWRVREALSRQGATGRQPVDRAQDALSRVWQQPGALHPQFTAGTIAPGALANLLLWDTDHPSFWPGDAPFRTLALGDTTMAIHAMFVLGQPLGTPGDFHQSLIRSDMYRASVEEASGRLAQLLEKVS